MISIDTEGRHPSTKEIAKFFSYHHLSGEARYTSQIIYEVACEMIDTYPDTPELVAGLRKLLEAKDCFVRVSLDL